jgi:magnesium-transporting ATPase (P-type)
MSTELKENIQRIVELGNKLKEPSNPQSDPDQKLVEPHADLIKQRDNFELGRDKQTHSMRIYSAVALFGFVVCWMVFVGFMLFRLATESNEFSLSDTVTIAMLTTTTINVFALLVIVAKWLFPNSGR